VLGDVVSSRQHPDQTALIHELSRALREALGHIPEGSILQPPEVTIGDEFQGAFTELAGALQFVLLVQLKLARSIDLRFGIGHGSIEAYDPSRAPLGQSGSAWWAARNSIDAVKAAQSERGSYRSCAFESADRTLGGAVEAMLTLRDRLMNDLDEKDLAIALGLATGEPQAAIAKAIGIDPAAVSRRKYTNAIDALLAAHEALTRRAE